MKDQVLQGDWLILLTVICCCCIIVLRPWGDWLILLTVICCCCIVVLRPRATSKVMSGRSVNLTTLRPPKRLTSTSCTYFRQ